MRDYTMVSQPPPSCHIKSTHPHIGATHFAELAIIWGERIFSSCYVIDVNDFINQSGWFSFQGLPYSKDSLHHVLAKKCRMSYEDFMKCKEAVYKFDYTNGEKV